jgi:RNA polymerase sigma factor (TIGR02999 family)
MNSESTPDNTEELFALVYEELRTLAAARLRNETPGQTLQATALVHEVFLRLVASKQKQEWDSVGHFFGAAAESMRRILVDYARKKRLRPKSTDEPAVAVKLEGLDDNLNADQLLELDTALQDFEKDDPVKAKLVVLRYFGGLSIEQACDAMGLSRTTANRYLTYSRAWLYRRITRAAE